MNKRNSIQYGVILWSMTISHGVMAFSHYFHRFIRGITYRPPIITNTIKWSPSKWGTGMIEAPQYDRGSQGPICEPYSNHKEKLVNEVTTFFEDALKGEKVEWTPFVRRVLPLVEPLDEYRTLYSDLKSVESPRGLAYYKKYCIKNALHDHQETLRDLLDREEAISSSEWLKIAQAIHV